MLKTLSIGLLVTTMLSGCDSVLDCLDNDGPVFSKSSLDVAILNEEYSDTIQASVRNEPRDSRFDYRFELSGRLPAGLSFRTSGRNFIIDGTPTQSGLFPLDLFVEVDDGLDPIDSGLCFRSRSTAYQLNVREI